MIEKVTRNVVFKPIKGCLLTFSESVSESGRSTVWSGDLPIQTCMVPATAHKKKHVGGFKTGSVTFREEHCVPALFEWLNSFLMSRRWSETVWIKFHIQQYIWKLLESLCCFKKSRMDPETNELSLWHCVTTMVVLCGNFLLLLPFSVPIRGKYVCAWTYVLGRFVSTSD